MEGATSLIILLVVFGGIFYFLLIRPQRKKQQQHEDLVDNLKTGDEVITAGGIHGSVTEVMEEDLLIEVEDGTVIKIQQDSVVETKSGDEDNEELNPGEEIEEDRL
ncbi:MAG: preprotein translocase subunit YajC [Candidatus Bipolaricaulota bacterium]|nr:preprotein translocase subunit YajC [Candidatus Bipolaricaulota bacterium]MBS3791658.1 preprotein translocase subunit YajC [Candidatus Bipolaricaulota bacterium]